VLKEGGHLGVTGLLDALPPRGRQVCRVLSNAIGAAASGLLAVGACRETITGMGNLAPVTDLPLGVVYLSAALGASFMAFVFLQALWRAVAGRADVDDAGRADMAEKRP
jgi:TRAP-type C4-dicarboxylate transport system permease small subunit